MVKVFNTLMALMFLAYAAMGQGGRDSVEIDKVKAGFKMISVNPDSALVIAQHGLQVSQRTGDKDLAGNAYLTEGWAWLHKGVYDKAFPDLLQSRELFHQIHDTLDEMHMDINLGMGYSMRSQFSTAAIYMLKADSLSRLVNDPGGKAEVKRQMGILYREQGQFAKAIPYFRESMDIFRAIGDTMFYFSAVGSLCIVYMTMKMPDSALALLNASIPLMGALRGRNYERAMLEERYGDVWFALSRNDKAMESYTNAYNIFARDNNKADMAYESMNVGKTYTAMKNYREAENYLLISYRLNDSLSLTNYARDAAEYLSDLYKTTGDWRNAYRWFHKEQALQDSLYLGDENEKAAQLQAKYETEKKDEEISLLKKDQELSRANLQKQKTFQYGSIVLGVLLLLIGVLAVNRYRTVQKARRLIELEKMRNTIARDLHDDMGSALSSINIISKVALENAEDKQKVNEHLKKIYENSGFMLENMSDIVWTINPFNDTLEKVLFKMKEFAVDMLEPLNIPYYFNQSENLQDVKLGLPVRKDLYLIFKEAVNNAAKYSKCSRIDIAIIETAGQLEMQIKDNGQGFDRNGVRKGNGLKNMEERAQRLKGILIISGALGQGTAVTLKLRSHD